jgi:hypothetical protein
MTKIPGLTVKTVLLAGRLQPSRLADDLRSACKWQQFNSETGEFSCAFYELPSNDVLAWIAQNSRPWTFAAHTVWH